MARVVRVLLYAALLLATLFYLMPAYLLVVSSFKPFAEAGLEQMWSLPHTISFTGLSEAWNGSPIVGEPGLATSFLNSVQIVVPSMLLSTLLGSLGGYILSKWKSRGADILFLLLLFSIFVPYQTVLIPLVQILQWSYLYGTIPGLILVHVIYGIPVTTCLFRIYYANFPTELFEAAQLDGASLLGVYRWILFPISVPGFGIVLVWQFMSIWNDFIFAASVTTPVTQPITVALNNMAGSFIVEWNVQMAGALLTALPPLVVYILLSRFLLRGLLPGSSKD